MKFLAFFFDHGPLLKTWNSMKLKGFKQIEIRKSGVHLKLHQTDKRRFYKAVHTNLPGFVGQSYLNGQSLGWNSHYRTSITLAQPSWFLSLLGIIPYIYLLICLLPFCPNSMWVLWSRDWICLTTAVFSATKRVANTVGSQFIFVENIFHLNYVPKLW